MAIGLGMLVYLLLSAPASSERVRTAKGLAVILGLPALLAGIPLAIKYRIEIRQHPAQILSGLGVACVSLVLAIMQTDVRPACAVLFTVPAPQLGFRLDFWGMLFWLFWFYAARPLYRGAVALLLRESSSVEASKGREQLNPSAR